MLVFTSTTPSSAMHSPVDGHTGAAKFVGSLSSLSVATSENATLQPASWESFARETTKYLE